MILSLSGKKWFLEIDSGNWDLGREYYAGEIGLFFGPWYLVIPWKRGSHARKLTARN